MRIKFSNQQKIDDPWWFSFSRTIVLISAESGENGGGRGQFPAHPR